MDISLSSGSIIDPTTIHMAARAINPASSGKGQFLTFIVSFGIPIAKMVPIGPFFLTKYIYIYLHVKHETKSHFFLQSHVYPYLLSGFG
jgi:hypothetical protein